MAHTILHPQGYASTPRPQAEVGAESVAYLVCNAAGLDSSGYTFGYVAGWSQGSVERIRQTAERVLRCAREIITALGLDQGSQDESAAQAA